VLDEEVSQRAIQELYLPPFKAAVTQAHVSTIMCAYPRLNGTFQCQQPQLVSLLDQWGFDGFVRSDLGAVHDPVAALSAGTDLIKPENAADLTTLVQQNDLPIAVVNAAVTRVLTQMFANGVIDREDEAGSPGDPVDSAAHTAVALRAAESSAVLLKNSHSVLPLSSGRPRTLAIIGADASSYPVTTGFGSSWVVAPFTTTPLSAIQRRAGAGTSVTYSNGGSTTGDLPPIPTDLLTPASGVGHGLTLTLTRTNSDPGIGILQGVEPTADLTISPHLLASGALPSTSTAPIDQPPAGRVIDDGVLTLGHQRHRTLSRVVLPPGWSNMTAVWTGTLTPPRSGLYVLSLEGSGGATLTLDGRPAVSDPLRHVSGRWSQAVQLTGGHHYQVRLHWQPFDHFTPAGVPSLTPGILTLGFKYVTPDITAAVEAARKAKVAVVFAGDFNSEAYDRPSLSLPGDENALISAVAAANPHTVVVLNTGGAVLMPWIGNVAGVVEDWYPGEVDGSAIAAVLFGDIDPSGRLPVTFPVSEAKSAINTAAQWPGINLTSYFSEGLEVGYRYYHATGISPLFPFGFGLAYTHFSIGNLRVSRSPGGVTLSVEVTNEGGRSGTDVPQAYLTYPSSAGEPPAQLVAFYSVTVRPHQSKTVNLQVPASAFQAFIGGGWTTVPGTYQLSVGQSSSNLPLSTSMAAP
jgi:beta-glucosidase